MAHKRNVYLKMKTLAEAHAVLFERFGHLQIPDTERVPAPEAVGRVLAEPVFARISSPNFHAAAMDGIAVRAAATFGASEHRPVTLAVGPEAVFVNTGHVLPEGCDAVVMIEHVRRLSGERVELDAPVFPWQHVRRMGEDIVATELLFARHHRVTPYCLGALLAAGVFSVPVLRQPRILIIPTGTELVDWRTTDPDRLSPGQVIESNAWVLGKLAEALGAAPERHPQVADDVAGIRQAVAGAVASFDMVLTVGGSSAGSEDYAQAVIADLGEILVHGVTIMPGKPIVIGEVSGTPVFGMPGYPVSAIIAFEQFVQPLLCHLQGRPDVARETVSVTPTRKIASPLGIEEFLRVKLGRVGERVVATPLPRGAGSITTFTEADGMVRIPQHMEGLREGEPVTAELLRPRGAVDTTVVIVGSHDNTLDVLADEIRAERNDVRISSSHVGSLGGLMAIKKGGCHMAGAHLLDPEDGTYNVNDVRRLLAGIPLRLVNLVFRDQGLIVARGNPKGIRGIEDLARDDVTMINRQGGSGTRILLDYRLRELGISPAALHGYADEEFTHMAVAVAVLSGTADAGLGIHAAARALGLDFVPVVTERYDLVIPDVHFDLHPVRVLLETIRTERFKARVRALGGYHTERTGEVVAEISG